MLKESDKTVQFINIFYIQVTDSNYFSLKKKWKENCHLNFPKKILTETYNMFNEKCTVSKDLYVRKIDKNQANLTIAKKPSWL